MVRLKPGMSPRQYLDELYEPSKAPTKAEKKDFRRITEKNYEEIIHQYSQLVYRWLWKFKDRHRYMRDHCEEFWQHIWVNRKKFNRKRGSLTTWLGWKFLGYWAEKARRARQEYQATDPLLSISDVFHHLHDSDEEISTWDDNLALNKIMSRADSSRWEQIDAEDEVVINDIISRLPKKDRQIIKALLDGHGKGKDLYKMGLTSGPKPELDDLKKRIKSVLNGAASGEAPSKEPLGKDYWKEYDKKYREEFPVTQMTGEKLDKLPTYSP